MIEAENYLSDIDIDDTEFVALSMYMKCKLWTGDKKLMNGLMKKGWNYCISTDELFVSLNLEANKKD